MKRRKFPAKHFVVCIDNGGYPASLELHKIYRVLPDEDAAEGGDIRVIGSGSASRCARGGRGDDDTKRYHGDSIPDLPEPKSMKKILLAVVTSSVLAGCAFPVISTELSDPSLRADRRTGSNLPPRWGDTNVKYMSREEFERLTSGQGSREGTPR